MGAEGEAGGACRGPWGRGSSLCKELVLKATESMVRDERPLGANETEEVPLWKGQARPG